MSCSGWKQIKIGDVGRIVTGKTPRTNIASNYGDYVSFLTPSDDMSVKHIESTKRKLSILGVNEVKNCLLPKGAICVSCIGSDLGKVVKTTSLTVTNQQINSIIPNECYDSDYIYYTMLILGRELNHISKTSTAVPIVNKSSFSNYYINIPNDLIEQQKIASILSSLDDKIELNRRINANLEAQAQAIFKSWFVDFEPFQNGEFIDSPLGDFVTFDPREKIIKDKGYAFFDMKCLPNNGMCLDSGIIRSALSGSVFRNNDTLLAKITPCLENGKTGFAMGLAEGEIARGSTEFVVMRSNGEGSPYWVYCLVRDSKFRDVAIQSMAGSSGRQRVQYQVLKQYPVFFTKPIMDNFHLLARPIFNEIEKNHQENQTLSALRDTLLPKLMNGEINL